MFPFLFSAIRRNGAAVLALFFICAVLIPLGSRPMIRPDEFRYAEIPREMIESGNWIVPKLNGMRYFEKPALGYQLTALSFKVFGENRFALRFPAALAMLLTAAFLWFLMRKTSRDPYLPSLTAGIWLTMGLVFGVGTYAVPDMPLTCALTFTIGGFWLAYHAKTIWEKIVWLILAGAACGIAFLLKGFLALAVPGVVIAPYLIWKRDWKAFLIDPWLPLIAALAVALPWSLKIAELEPDFWRYFFMEEHVNRFLGRTYDRRPQPFWYFLPVLLGGILPAGLLWFSGWRGLTKKMLLQDRSRFMLCWFLFPFLMFSASSCKLGGYILPCFPAIAVLTASALRYVMLTNRQKFLKTLESLRLCWGVFWIIAALTGALALAILPHFLKIPFTVAPCLFSAAAFIYGLTLLLMKKTNPFRELQILFLGLIPLLMLGMEAVPAPLFGNKMPEETLKKCLKEIKAGPKDTILVERSGIATAAWTLKRSDLIVYWFPGELTYSFKNYKEYADRFDREGTRLPEIIRRAAPHKTILILISKLRGGKALPETENMVCVSDGGIQVLCFQNGSIQPPPSSRSSR